MTPEDDTNDAGKDVKIIGRWHKVGGGGGTCICETDNIEALNSWMLNWAGMCDISVNVVIDDASSRKVIKTKNL